MQLNKDWPHCEVNRSYEEKGERKYSNKTPKII